MSTIIAELKEIPFSAVPGISLRFYVRNFLKLWPASFATWAIALAAELSLTWVFKQNWPANIILVAPLYCYASYQQLSQIARLLQRHAEKSMWRTSLHHMLASVATLVIQIGYMVIPLAIIWESLEAVDRGYSPTGGLVATSGEAFCTLSFLFSGLLLFIWCFVGTYITLPATIVMGLPLTKAVRLNWRLLSRNWTITSLGYLFVLIVQIIMQIPAIIFAFTHERRAASNILLNYDLPMWSLLFFGVSIALPLVFILGTFFAIYLEHRYTPDLSHSSMPIG